MKVVRSRIPSPGPRGSDGRVTSAVVTRASSDSDRDYLEMLAKAAALGTALLPATGYLVRVIALWPVKGSSWSIAWSAPIAQLVLLGFFPVGASVIWLLVASFLFGGKSGSRKERTEGVRFRRQVWVGVPLSGVLALLRAFLVKLPGAPAHRARFCREPALYGEGLSAACKGVVLHVWPAFVVIIVAAAIVYGLSGGLGTDVSQYEFGDTAGLPPSGRYQQLGTTGGRIILEPCDPAPRETVVVQEQDILVSRPETFWSVPNPSLWGVLRGSDFTLGLQRC